MLDRVRPARVACAPPRCGHVCVVVAPVCVWGVRIGASTLLLPARDDLALAERQLSVLREQHQLTTARMAAYDQFLMELEAGDPAFVQRLAASELNLLPKGDSPVLHDIAAARTSTLEWIESSVPQATSSRSDGADLPQTMLGDISHGAYRNLFLGGGIACIFFGLLTSLPSDRRNRIDVDVSHDAAC